MPTLGDCLDRYTAALVGQGRRPRGIARYLQHLRAFDEFHGGLALDDLNRAAVARYQEDLARRCAIKTVIGALSCIRSFCQWAICEELLARDPTTLVRWPKKPEPVPRALKRAEVRVLLKAMVEPPFLTLKQRWSHRRNRRAVLLMLYAGMRMGEVIGLRWRDVDLDHAMLLVRDGKGGRSRSIPLHPVLLAELRTASGLPQHAVAGTMEGTPLVREIDHLFRRWLRKNGIEISAHQLRHSFATELMRQGVNLRAIQELLGHKQLETTQRYLMVEVEHLREAVGQLPTEW